MPEGGRHRVVIAGGGIAGLEALLALTDLAGEWVQTTVVAPTDEFVYKPLAVEEPFAPGTVERRDLAPIVEGEGARFLRQRVTAVRPDRHLCELADGSTLEYDAVVVCVGAKPRAAFAHAETLRTSGEPIDVDGLLRQAAEHSSQRLALLLPPRGSWPLPIYEFALLAARRANDLGLDVRSMVVTPESRPLIVFGPAASEAVAALLDARGIEVIAGKRAEERANGEIHLIPGDERLEAGAAVALPALQGPAIARLPADEHGFIPIDEHCRVRGHDDVYAAGDGTNFPIKHGGLGTEQADAAGESIAAAAGADVEPRPFRPVIRGKLIAGEESLSLTAPLSGGAGEGQASLDYLWWPPHKVAGRYLAPYLAGRMPHEQMTPPPHGLDVEVELPHGWHREPMALDPYGSPDLPAGGR
jgi:sulfide:quinone oxidoreductase